MQPRVSLLSSLWEGQYGQVPFEFLSGPSNILHFITTESKSRSIKSKKGTRPISGHLEVVWSIKDLLNAPITKIIFFVRDQRGKSRAGKIGTSKCEQMLDSKTYN